MAVRGSTERGPATDHPAGASGQGGAIRREGRRLMDLWWQEMTAADETGRPAAYVFVMGSLCELLRVFDVVLNAPEITSLQTAIRGHSLTYIQAAEDYGYSPDICGYVKADVGLQLKGRTHPHGKVPPPGLAVATNMCNTYIKWAEIWEQLYHCPVFVLDLPAWRGTGADLRRDGEAFQNDRRYVERQLGDLIALCERVTGKAFDIDRLREAMAEVNRLAACYQEVVALNRTRPAPFSAIREGIVFQGISNLYRGSPEGPRFFEAAREELEERVRRGQGTVPAEKFRLMLGGTTCYAAFKRFAELFEEWGGTFVHSTYMVFAGGGFPPGFGYDLAHPIESLAEELLLSAWRGFSTPMFYAQDWLAETAQEWSVDGICFHGVKSCRTTSTGLPDVREWLRTHNDIPGLFIQSDLVDPRLWSDAQLKNRVDAFIESLAGRKAAAGAGR
ncbi:MAG TPA: 2-hydroxyacyl-CoA dehydratase family protein [bacterium]|nr:2-hydroxyacyl-CoA dehydratase family protein [bacterium]